MVTARDYEAICDLSIESHSSMTFFFFFKQIILQHLNIIFMGIKIPMKYQARF